MKRTQEEYSTLCITHLLRRADITILSDSSPQSFSITQLPEGRGRFLVTLFSISVSVTFTRNHGDDIKTTLGASVISARGVVEA